MVQRFKNTVFTKQSNTENWWDFFRFIFKRFFVF